MSFVSSLRSVLGLNDESGSEPESGSESGEDVLEVDDAELEDELRELIYSEFEVDEFDVDVSIGDRDEFEVSEFVFWWRDESGVEYELEVETDTVYEGYVVEFEVEDSDEVRLREVPASDVVGRGRALF